MLINQLVCTLEQALDSNSAASSWGIKPNRSFRRSFSGGGLNILSKNMKKDIHPEYFKDTTVTCVCGNKFTTGSTVKEIQTEICSACHPFYTGKQKLVDTARRVEKFEDKVKKQKAMTKEKKPQSKKTKRAKRTTKKTTAKK